MPSGAVPAAMPRTRPVLRRWPALLLAAALGAGCAPEADAPPAADPVAARLLARYQPLAEALARDCPFGDPADRTAFDRCRAALFGVSALRAALPERLLWGRARGLPVADTPLTRFSPDVFAGLYAPLFMYAGTVDLRYDRGEHRYLATLPVRFRDGLPPGLFPYPFWHDATKWSSYRAATALRFYLDADSGLVQVVQFVAGPIAAPLAEAARAEAAAFDGRWMWTDADGRRQPQVTLFDGLFAADNPYLPAIDRTYRALALDLRDQACVDCHAPDNGGKMERIVLLQTPAHAAGEIKRLIRSVQRDEMPQDERGRVLPLAPEVKARLLDKARAFDAALDAARAWQRPGLAGAADRH